MTTTTDEFGGPLAGVRVVELAGIGPGPFARCCWPTWAPR
jgi:alpha-methylacyl-CoA racemase